MNDEKLRLGIGTEETKSLQPLVVVVKSVKIESVNVKTGTAEKVVCEVMHPGSNDPIHISQMKWENKGKLEVTGLWLKEGKDGIVKNSGLAHLMRTFGAKTIVELNGKSIPTVLDEKGYLAFKGY